MPAPRRLVLDLDGVLLDFEAGVVELHNRQQELYGFRRGEPKMAKRPHSRPEAYGALFRRAGFETADAFWEWFHANSGWRHVRAYPGVVDRLIGFLGAYRDVFNPQVRLVTSRPHTAVEDTTETVRQAFAGRVLYTLVFTADKAAQVDDYQTWVEDDPYHLDALVEAAASREGTNVYRVRHPWNKGHPTPVWTWKLR